MSDISLQLLRVPYSISIYRSSVDCFLLDQSLDTKKLDPTVPPTWKAHPLFAIDARPVVLIDSSRSTFDYITALEWPC